MKKKKNKKTIDLKNNKAVTFINKQTKKMNLEKNKFNAIELGLVFIMALVFGLLIGEMVFSDGSNSNTITKKTNTNIKEIENVYDTIQSEYIDKVDSSKLKEAAIEGMMSVLGDNYTSYYNEEESKTFNEEIQGSFYGMGAEIYQDQNGAILINRVFDNTPAAKAGLKVGDKYLKVNNEDITKKQVDEIAKMIKGKKNKTFTLTVLRNNEEITVKITTTKIEIPSVSSEIINEKGKKIGYIDIDIFATNTDEQFAKHLQKLEKENIDKLIIDLRSNVGGDLDTVINVASNFLTKKDVVVQMISKNKVDKKYAKGTNVKTYDMVVLINESSASGAEVLASTLNENLNATLVGTTTFGKGTAQKTKTLSNDSIIKYTVQTWKTSKGKEIDKKGITPTVELKLNENYFKTQKESDDNQLQKAIELLSK